MEEKKEIKIMWLETITNYCVFTIKFILVLALIVYLLHNYDMIGVILSVLLIFNAKLGQPSVTYEVDILK